MFGVLLCVVHSIGWSSECKEEVSKSRNLSGSVAGSYGVAGLGEVCMELLM